jgi:hypothetical protein
MCQTVFANIYFTIFDLEIFNNPVETTEIASLYIDITLENENLNYNRKTFLMVRPLFRRV